MFSFQSDGFSLGSVYLLLLLLFSSWFVCLFTVPLCQLSAIANEQLAQTFAHSCILAMNAVNSKYDLVFVLWLDALIWTAWNSLARSARSIWVNGDKWKRKRLQYWCVCVCEREGETVNMSQPEVNRARALRKLQIVVFLRLYYCYSVKTIQFVLSKNSECCVVLLIICSWALTHTRAPIVLC